MFVIYDTEFTAWDGSAQRGWDQPHEFREIIQMSAVLVDPRQVCEVDSLDLVVKLTLTEDVPEYTQNLTGISSADMLERGEPFIDQVERFFEFCHARQAWAYGNDSLVIGENIGLTSQPTWPIPLPLPILGNLQPLVCAAEPSLRGVSSGNLWEALGLPRPGLDQEHNSLHDCRSVLAAVNHLRDREPLASWLESVQED